MSEQDVLEFQSTVERPEGVGTWTFLPIPIDLKTRFGAAGQIKVRGTIDGEPFRSSVLPQGDGTHYLVVRSEIRERINATVGSNVKVILERDSEERSVVIPEDFLHAMSRDGRTKATFDAFSYSTRKEYVDWIEAAKTEATHSKRIELALGMIAEKSSPKRPKRR